MTGRRTARPLAVAALFLAACTGETRLVGVGEPILVYGATFRAGEMPEPSGGPLVTALESTGGVWSRGQLGRTLSGRVADSAYAVGIQLAGLGTGYWVFPAAALDPAFPGERIWDVVHDVGGGVPAGLHTLRIVAFDEAGRAGAYREIPVCIADLRVRDNLNACDPTIPPPDAVIALDWDRDVDLDLIVVTPEGKVVDARHPTTAFAGEGMRIPPELFDDPGHGRLDGDSLAECLPDGRNSESLSFQAPARVAGFYHVYANLFDACGQQSVHFAVTIYRRRTLEDGTYRLEQVERRPGLLLGLAANGGSAPPLYVTSVDLP
ncbi:MAG: hypothetical protein KF729_13850 [Sandaracinaceae bacterium]|nr:hypothetical protein [Sandaracinaceae bacterium]